MKKNKIIYTLTEIFIMLMFYLIANDTLFISNIKLKDLVLLYFGRIILLYVFFYIYKAMTKKYIKEIHLIYYNVIFIFFLILFFLIFKI